MSIIFQILENHELYVICKDIVQKLSAAISGVTKLDKTEM
jgi:hypothetical protein